LINDGKTEYAVGIITDKGVNNCGLSFFIGKEGLNTLHDMYSSAESDSMEISDYNMITALMADSKKLLDEELSFFKKNDIKIKNKNNIVLKTFKSGIEPYVSTSKDADLMIELLSFVLLLIENDKDTLIEGFSNNLLAYMTVNYRRHIYSLNMINIPYLEREYDKVLANEMELKGFLEYNHSDYEAELIMKNIEVPIKVDDFNKNIYPLSVVYLVDEKVIEAQAVVTTPLEYKENIIPILHNIFKSEGIPKKIKTNNRALYYKLYDLLDKIGVELILQEPSALGFKLMKITNQTLNEYFLYQPNNLRNKSVFLNKHDFMKHVLKNDLDRNNLENDDVFLLLTFFSHLNVDKFIDEAMADYEEEESKEDLVS
ncbi:MAG: hypothetical protein ACI35W_06220, partial [Anaeroplasmataceae bacterium]